MKPKLDVNRFKISFSQRDTYVFQSGNDIIAILEGDVDVPSIVKHDDFLGFSYPHVIDLTPFHVKGKGVARLAPGDKFNAEKGRKIALAKAENDIYRQVDKYLTNRMEELIAFNSCVLAFKEKVANVTEHNLKYINELGEKE